MSEIKIIEKPESVSWETIRDVLQQAHQVHFDAGLVMYTTTLTAEQLETRIKKNGVCYVAMDGDQVVGTGSIRIMDFHRWYCNGSAAEFTMLGVLPSYQGRHIGTELTKAREEEVKRRGIGTICFDTAERNTRKIQMSLKDQYRLVDYRFRNGHYSIVMVKWLEKSPFSKFYCKMRFNYKKTKVRFLHFLKPNVKRIG